MVRSLRILVVEDTPIAQVVVKTQFTQFGCNVDIASEADMALEKALTNSYDLILMDIGLGDGPDGFDVTMRIKNESHLNKMTPIMVVSAHGAPDYKQKAREYGMAGYFKKPFTVADAKFLLDSYKTGLIIPHYFQ